MTAAAGSICFACKRWRGRVCEAFPDGIPESIMFDGFDHRQPHEGDHDLRFVLDDPRLLAAYEDMNTLVAGLDVDPEPEFKHGDKGEPGYELLHPTLRVTYEDRGRVGERTHITRDAMGTLPIAAVANLMGVMGEKPGEHRNRRGEAWEEFLADIRANGILTPIFITVDYGEEPRISEGNHRRDAAVELGFTEVPVHVRFFGHAERESRWPMAKKEAKHGEPGEPGYHLKHPGRYLSALREHPVNVKLTNAFEGSGHSLFLVGGSVRDALAGNVNFADLDYTTDARPEQIRQVVDDLGPLWEVGEQFGTIGVQIDGLKTEITTYRKEVYEGDSRKPTVAFGDNIADDLARRDLTMNAMALTLVGDGTHQPGDLVDPYGGANDLAAGVLRTPDDPLKSMSEDPLRQLRVVRFAAKRDAAVDPELTDAILAMNDRLAIVSAEEMRKILAVGPQVTANAVDLARDLGVASQLFAGLDTSPARADAVRRLPPDADPVAMLAVLADGVPDAEDRMRAAVLMNDEIGPVRAAVRVLDAMRTIPASRIEARRLVRDYEPDTVRRALAAMDVLDGERSAMAVEVADVVATEEAAVRVPPPITGRDLIAAGMKPGPGMGEALRRAMEAFLADPSIDRDALLAAALRGAG